MAPLCQADEDPRLDEVVQCNVCELVFIVCYPLWECVEESLPSRHLCIEFRGCVLLNLLLKKKTKELS